jgi:enoyl-[acyl-carrier protein] reductase III
MSLQGASVLVTGGTRGIGRAIALRLVADGAARAVLGYMRNDTAAEEAAALVQEAGASAVLVRGNVSDPETVEELAAGGPYRVVVHNAATGVIRPALETEDKHWDWTLNANARTLLALARATAPAMEPGSAIVAISSLGSVRVLENYVLIGASKAALEAVVRYLGVELAPRGIRVNAVSGGVVETAALEHFPNKEEMLATADRTPAGRLVEPADMAGAVSFLCSNDARMICGQTIVVDGGFSLPA